MNAPSGTNGNAVPEGVGDATVVLVGFIRPHAMARTAGAIRDIQWPGAIVAQLSQPRPGVPGDAEAIAETQVVLQDVLGGLDLTIVRPAQHVSVGEAIPDAVALGLARTDGVIVLEDDCVPSPDFLPFAAAMLHRHADDDEVWHVNGNNFGARFDFGDADYGFGRFAASWGWATWRRAWSHYRPLIDDPPAVQRQVLRGAGLSYSQRRERQKRWATVAQGPPLHTWDYQWQYQLDRAEAVAIVPSRNMIQNIGFGPEASHTFDATDWRAEIPTERLPGPWTSPAHRAPDEAVGRWYASASLGPPLGFRDLARGKVRRHLAPITSRMAS